MTEDYIEGIRKLAYHAHENPSKSQRYGNAPYRVHLDCVVGYIKKYLYYIDKIYHNDLICAGYCHDLIEDTEFSFNSLKEKTNSRVARLVSLVTNERGDNRKERNFKTYPKIWSNDLAIFLKICDRLANTSNSKKSGHVMYKVYMEEYPVFRYALKIKGLYTEMWKELDKLNEYEIIEVK